MPRGLALDCGVLMSNAPCWVQRFEVDPRYDYHADTFDDDAPGMAPNCDHETCAAEMQRHADSTYECDLCTGVTLWDCPISECRWDTIHAMCDLDKGHAGEHVFVSSDEIVLMFPDAVEAV